MIIISTQISQCEIEAGNDVRFWLHYWDDQIWIIRMHEETRGIRRSCFSHALNPVWCGISSPAWLDLGQTHPEKKDIRTIPQRMKIEHLLYPHCQVSDNRPSSESLVWPLNSVSSPELHQRPCQTTCCGFYLWFTDDGKWENHNVLWFLFAYLFNH